MTRRDVIGMVLISLACASGCVEERKKKPDHVVQQEQRKKQRVAAQKKKKAEQARNKKPKEKGEDESWPGPVRLAFYNLYTAKISQWPSSARALAMFGPDAIPAMKRLIKNPRQPGKKKALVSFLLVQMHMFRPEALTHMARDEEVPFARRGAIEALAIIGNAQTKQVLAAIRQELKNAPRPRPQAKKDSHGHQGHGHGPGGHGQEKPDPRAKTDPFKPIIDFIDRAQKSGSSWGYSSKQLAVLDSVFHAKSKMELKVAMDWIKDFSLEDGMVAMMRSPVVRPIVHTELTKRLVQLASSKPKKYRDYCEPGYPQMLRMLAAKKLLDGKNKDDRLYLKKLAANGRDPIAPFLQNILAGRTPFAPR